MLAIKNTLMKILNSTAPLKCALAGFDCNFLGPSRSRLYLRCRWLCLNAWSHFPPDPWHGEEEPLHEVTLWASKVMLVLLRPWLTSSKPIVHPFSTPRWGNEYHCRWRTSHYPSLVDIIAWHEGWQMEITNRHLNFACILFRYLLEPWSILWRSGSNGSECHGSYSRCFFFSRAEIAIGKDSFPGRRE